MLSWQCEAWKHEAAWTGLQKPVQHFQSLPSPISVSRALFTPGIISPSSSSSHSSSSFGRPESLLLSWHLVASSYLDLKNNGGEFLNNPSLILFCFSWVWWPYQPKKLLASHDCSLAFFTRNSFSYRWLQKETDRRKFAQFSVSLCCFN